MKKIVEAYRKGKLITPPHIFYLEIDPDGVFTVNNPEKIVNGTSLLPYIPKYSQKKLAFENCTDATWMFGFGGSRGEKISIKLPNASTISMLTQDSYFDEIEILAPEATNCWGAMNRCQIATKLVLHAPKATNIQYLACYCYAIEEFEFNTQAIYADNMCFGCVKLKNANIKLTNCVSVKGAFWKCALSADQINAILQSLPHHATGSHIITFTDCLGAVDCSPEIGTQKGWTVEL